jgi:heme exporter protein D
MRFNKTLPWIALASVILGLATMMYSLHATPALLKQISRRQADIAQLQSLQQQRAENRSAIQLYEQLSTKKAVPLKDLAASAGLPSAPEVRLRDDAPAAGGWIVRSADVQFESIRLADLAHFLKIAQNSRPPWRLRECTLTAVGSAPGEARASLAMETLEKKSP